MGRQNRCEGTEEFRVRQLCWRGRWSPRFKQEVLVIKQQDKGRQGRRKEWRVARRGIPAEHGDVRSVAGCE